MQAVQNQRAANSKVENYSVRYSPAMGLLRKSERVIDSRSKTEKAGRPVGMVCPRYGG
jgi:hypothetical protein